jgi:hypothetical protein
MENQDLINLQNSFKQLATLTLPKGTLTLLSPDRWYLPKVTFSYWRVSNSLELAKIDADTGLQEAVGPSRNRVISVSMQLYFSHGAIYVSYAQADARDRETGEPIPEAPRMIWDAVGSWNRLPFRLQARGGAPALHYPCAPLRAYST